MCQVNEPRDAVKQLTWSGEVLEEWVTYLLGLGKKGRAADLPSWLEEEKGQGQITYLPDQREGWVNSSLDWSDQVFIQGRGS